MAFGVSNMCYLLYPKSHNSAISVTQFSGSAVKFGNAMLFTFLFIHKVYDRGNVKINFWLNFLIESDRMVVYAATKPTIARELWDHINKTSLKLADN